MSRKDIIMIRQKELKRLHVIHRVLNGEITQAEALDILSISGRQTRRIISRIRQEGDIGIVHKSRGKESNRIDLDAILCIKTARTVRNDNTISYQKELYQIEEVMAGKIVTVTERIDGTMRMYYQGRNLKFRQIKVRPERPQKQKVKTRQRAVYIPPADHPWRKFKIGKNAYYAEKNTMEVS